MSRRAVIALLCLITPVDAYSLYSWQGESSQGDVRLLLRGFALYSQPPSDMSLYEEQNSTDLGGLARLISEYHNTDGWSVELNAYQTYIDKDLVSEQGQFGLVESVERSGLLEWGFSNDEYAHMAIDRFNIKWSLRSLNLTLGRQAINLATTFFFTPNDFFAPFSAQTFYRVYKPGVDAIRAEWSLGDLSTFSLIGVQGYSRQPEAESGWSDAPESSRNSYLARLITNQGGFEWGLLVGKVRRNRIIGGSISGEVFDWLGVRAEGHQLEELDEAERKRSVFSIGLEHRWENSLTIQLEQFYNGSGATNVADYNFNAGYPARRYQVLGISYEITPLLFGQANIIRNHQDASRLYSINTTYSISDESELSASLTIPQGEKAAGPVVRSEYGIYPRVLNIEFRVYF